MQSLEIIDVAWQQLEWDGQGDSVLNIIAGGGKYGRDRLSWRVLTY